MLKAERECTGCGRLQPGEGFAFKNKAVGKWHSRCKTCTRQSAIRHYSLHRARYITRNRLNNPRQRRRAASIVYEFLLGKRCRICGEDDPVVLEFDHRDRLSKSANVADLVQRMCSAERLFAEMAKCDVLCANCHQRLTSTSRVSHYRISHGAGAASVKAFRRAANARNHRVALEYLAFSGVR